MKIQGKEIIADDGKYLHRIGSDAYFKRCTLLSGENESNFEEVDTIPEQPEEPTAPAESKESMAMRVVAMSLNKISLSNEEALSVAPLFEEHFNWSDYIGKSLAKGIIIWWNGNLYKTRQEISNVLVTQPPSLETAALYEAINKENAGTMDDPIPYVPPMEIFEGKYYTQNGILYRCTRNSGQALTHDLSALVGLYVEQV